MKDNQSKKNLHLKPQKLKEQILKELNKSLVMLNIYQTNNLS